MTRQTAAPGSRTQPAADVGLKIMGVFLALSILFWAVVVLADPLSNGHWTAIQARNLYSKLQRPILDEKEVSKATKDENLLPKGFDKKSCRGRFESPQYRRGEMRKAYPYLLSKLRSYEARHKKCGVYTEPYNKSVQLLKSGGSYNSSLVESDCKYIVWTSLEGLGNKMLTLTSTFLYALLTDRLVLADRGVDIPDLFCEPFPQVSWFLPLDFPFTDKLSNIYQEWNRIYGNLVEQKHTELQPYIFLYLKNHFDGQHRRFFCDEDQTYLHSIPWLIMYTDQYILPSFFLIPSFQQELDSLFPEKETVFHLLGRYLLHPTNSVWELVTRYYESYLSKADEIVGIQIRYYGSNDGPFTHDQILSCTKRENILPQVTEFNSNTTSTCNNNTTIAILMASLSLTYFERVRDLYYENPTVNGEVVSVFQPSHQWYQQSDNHDHNRKALAEMYLLSFSDRLVTSGWSTFGYVAQSLGGLHPWILYYIPDNKGTPDPPCQRGLSLEPCFHTPPYYDCKSKGWADASGDSTNVRHCEEFSNGIRLV